MSRGGADIQSGHLPVLYAQVMDGLAVKADGTYLDGTFGRGGHARGVLSELGPGGRLVLMDKDPDAIAGAARRVPQAAPGATATHPAVFAATAGSLPTEELLAV